MSFTEIEIQILNKKKQDLIDTINPLLSQINSAIPEFSGKDAYRDKVLDIFHNQLFNDSELNSYLINESSAAVLDAVCMIDPTSLDALGLTDYCSGGD